MTDRFGFKPDYLPTAPTQPPNSSASFPHYPPSNPPHFYPPLPSNPPDNCNCDIHQNLPNNPPGPSIPPSNCNCDIHQNLPHNPPGPSVPSSNCNCDIHQNLPHNPPIPVDPPNSYYPSQHHPQWNPPHNYPAAPPQHFPHHPEWHQTNYPPPPGPPDNCYAVKGYYWVATTARSGVPPTAVRGGVDQDGTQIYVGRANHEGDWIPAKVIPEKHIAYVAYGGKEHGKTEYQVLCEQTFEWVPTHGKNIPAEAVVGGQTSDGEPLYVGRVHHEGSHTVGKVQPSHGTCYIPFSGEELGFADYEILVLRG